MARRYPFSSRGGGSGTSEPRGRRRPDCVRYRLVGSCDYGRTCRFLHGRVLLPHQRFVEYVPLPEGLPMSVAVGRNGSNLKPIYEGIDCIIEASDKRPNEVKVVSSSEQDLGTAIARLKVALVQVYTLGPTWCYLHTDGLKAAEGVIFRQTEGRRPQQYSAKGATLYEACGAKMQPVASSEEDDELVEKLEKLTVSKVDSKAVLHDALDSTNARMAPLKQRVRIVAKYDDEIRERLKDALEWFLKEGHNESSALKLEARFGKLLWADLPQDILSDDEPQTPQQFAEFVLGDSNHMRVFNTKVNEESAKKLGEDLEEIGEPKPMLETIDIKMSRFAQDIQNRGKVDLRLKLKNDKLELVAVRKGERKILSFDIVCLHRQHDMRLSLNDFEVVTDKSPLYSVVQRMLKTLTYSKPGILEFDAHTPEWTVEFIRNKKRTPYVIDGKYITTISAVREHRVPKNFHDSQPGGYTLVDLQECREHYEVEFHNMVWDCSFGRSAFPTPESCLNLFMEEPTVDPEVLATLPLPGQTWSPDKILEDVDEVLQNVEQTNESLD